MKRKTGYFEIEMAFITIIMTAFFIAGVFFLLQ